MNIIWKDYIHNADTNSKWKPPVDKHFIDHLLPTLAAIPLRRTPEGKIDSTKTFNQMPELVNGIYNGDDVKRMLGFLYMMPRSKLLVMSQGKDPRLGSLTPLAMYAHKLYNEVQYEEWDKEDPFLKYFLGKFLEPLVSTDYSIPVLNVDDIMKARQEALMNKSGAKAGILAKVTDYKCNINGFKIDRYEDDELFQDSPTQMILLPKVVIIMKLQTWIANVALRNTSSMILDPKNWDAVPKPLDVVVSMTKEERPW